MAEDKRIKLNDEDKKKIIADYIETQNYSESARLNNVSVDTVRRLVRENDDVVNKLKQKKEENTKDILKYMDSIYDTQKEIIDLSLNALKIKLNNLDNSTNVKDIATVYGVIFDKALKYKEIKIKNEEANSNSINLNIIDISKLINNPVENRNEDNIDE